ncbi:MAG: hypothetical protein Q9205_003073 [Flavoplaca limonia]
MVKLPSLKDICTEELGLDDAASKQLRADAKEFRAAWIADNGGEVITNKELAFRYFTDGYPFAAVKPGSLLWQSSGPDTDAPRNVLPRNEEILLRGVERVFAKLERYARDTRKTHGRATTAVEEVMGSNVPIFADLKQDDNFPEILDLLNASKTTSSVRGPGEGADEVARSSTTTTRGNDAQVTSSACKDENSFTTWDPILADPRNRKDKEYEPSIRQKWDATRTYFGTPSHMSPGEQEDANMEQSAVKRRRRHHSPQGFAFTTKGNAIVGENGRTSTERAIEDDSHTGVMAPLLQSEVEIPDSPLSAQEDDLDGTSITQGDNRSQTYVAPTSSHHDDDTGGEDERELYDASTRGTSTPMEKTPEREESVDLGSCFLRQATDAQRQAAGDAMSLPPNIWILAPNQSWVCWDKTSLDAVDLGTIGDEIKRQMGMEHVESLRMRISDRQEKWTIVLRLGEELRHQDIKAMVKADTRIRDVYYSPVN